MNIEELSQKLKVRETKLRDELNDYEGRIAALQTSAHAVRTAISENIDFQSMIKELKLNETR